MKLNHTLWMLMLSALSMNLSAQKPITLKEDSLSFGTARYPGISVTIPEVSYDRTEKNWIKELQSGTKSKVVAENGEMSIFGAIIKDISPNPLNIYSKLVSQDSLQQLFVAFETKKDQYIEKANGDAELIAAREYLKQFAKSQYMDFVKDEVQAEDKKLKDLTNELNALKNEKSRMQKSIQSNRTTIIEERDNIVLQNNDLAKVSAELITENNLLTSMEEGAAREAKASYIRDLEKRKKKILNGIESSENRITKANNDINDADRDIPKNESEQETLIGKIAQQEMVLQKYTTKLNTVKGY